MDRQLKERMIGAVVLVAAAIILIPEMLSGPHDPGEPAKSESRMAQVAHVAQTAPDEAKLKTYTIDLSKSITQGSVAESPAKSAPIAEPAPADASKRVANTIPAVSESTFKQAPGSVTETRPELLKPEATKPEKPKPTPTKQPDLAVKPAANPALASAAVPDAAWSVQVGSFEVRARSDRIAADLKHEGFPAYVVAFQSGAQTMYRVRIGPARDRQAAEALLQKLKSDHPNATLVAPP